MGTIHNYRNRNGPLPIAKDSNNSPKRDSSFLYISFYFIFVCNQPGLLLVVAV